MKSLVGITCAKLSVQVILVQNMIPVVVVAQNTINTAFHEHMLLEQM